MDLIKKILNAAGVTHRRGRFLKPPSNTYAVYFDDVSVDAADRVTPATPAGLPRIYNHSARVELYEPEPDDNTEAAIEAALDAEGVEYDKEDRYWLQDEQRYQVLYSFEYITKT